MTEILYIGNLPELVNNRTPDNDILLFIYSKDALKATLLMLDSLELTWSNGLNLVQSKIIPYEDEVYTSNGVGLRIDHRGVKYGRVSTYEAYQHDLERIYRIVL